MATVLVCGKAGAWLGFELRFGAWFGASFSPAFSLQEGAMYKRFTAAPMVHGKDDHCSCIDQLTGLVNIVN